MKQFFEQYGGVALGILALLVLIAMITPVGNIIKTSLQGTAHKFSSSINSQVDDDLNAIATIQNNIETSITISGNIVNYNGQSSFPSTYTEADIIWPANYDFKDSFTVYVEVEGRTSALDNPNVNIFGNWEVAGGGISFKSEKVCGTVYIDGGSAYKKVCTTNYDLNNLNRFALTYDGSALKFYSNGNLESTLALTGDIKISPYGFTLGNADSETTRSTHDEKIHRVAVFDGALSLEEINSLQYK